MASVHVLMRHPDLGLTAEMAAGSEDIWRARGWLLADEPDPIPAADNTLPDTDVPPPADETTNRPAARKRATDSQE